LYSGRIDFSTLVNRVSNVVRIAGGLDESSRLEKEGWRSFRLTDHALGYLTGFVQILFELGEVWLARQRRLGICIYIYQLDFGALVFHGVE
jgi:hypothetical protein